jgi:hypothetical protein
MSPGPRPRVSYIYDGSTVSKPNAARSGSRLRRRLACRNSMAFVGLAHHRNLNKSDLKQVEGIRAITMMD